MDPVIAAAAELFQVGGHLFPKSLEGLERGDLLRAPGDANPMIWLAGHLTYCRCAVSRFTGSNRELPWAELFGRYSKLADDSAYPSIDAVLAVWNEASAEIPERLKQLDEAALAAPAPSRMPVKDPSLRGAISFMAWHEAYHVGQMAYVRKWLGKGGLIDG